MRTDMPLAATICRNTVSPRSGPIAPKMPASQSESSASMPSFPFQRGCARSSHVFGRSSFFTIFVLYACTKTLRREPTHSPCGRIAGSIRSAWCGLLIACRICSRLSDSISGPLVSTTSTVWRPARASAMARLSTDSEPARQIVARMPYFFS